MIRLRRLVCAGAGIAVISGLVACAASSPPPDLLDVDGIDLQNYANVSANLDFDEGSVTLPVDSIDHVGPEFMEAEHDALRALVDSCLGELGLPPYAWSVPPAEQMDNRLYGSWSIPFASRYGFASSSEGEAPAPPVLTLEEQGCFSGAKGELGPVLEGIDTVDIDTQISSTAYDSVRASAEGRAALRAAQDCMRGKGLTLNSTSGLPVLDYSMPNSEANIRAAVIVATCNVDTGAIQTLFDLTARYQTALMDRNEAAVAALQQKNADRIAALKAIVDRNG